MTNANENLHIVNRTMADLRGFGNAIAAAYHTGELDEDSADLFKLTWLRAYNPDGSDRMLVDWA